MKHWLAAFRLKTLPLALGAIILGSSIDSSSFDWSIFFFAALTAICLQVLSNLANDYGDFVKGTDKHRTDRQLAGGTITPKAMKSAIVILTLGSFLSGLYLLFISFGDELKYWIGFLGLGIASIIAAITYTVGKKAYGYNGLGDLFVFVFFGLVGVLGTSFLFDQSIHWINVLPAVAYGCLCMGVLNVNNIRDLNKDVLTNKITLAAKLGKSGAENYQKALMTVALLCFVGFHFLAEKWSLAPLGMVILGILHIQKLIRAENSSDYNAQLKLLSIGSLIISIIFTAHFTI
ncbi:MAG: 1,4-dihydroxy-2-naphthoate octaprenyltransferase [Bacteroidia bacterium]